MYDIIKEIDKKEIIALGGLCCCNTRKAIIKRIDREGLGCQVIQVATIQFQHRDPGQGTFYDDNYFYMTKEELSRFINILLQLHKDMDQSANITQQTKCTKD